MKRRTRTITETHEVWVVRRLPAAAERPPDSGAAANGGYDFEFRLYDAGAGGALLGTVTVEDAVVEDGAFTVRLDFGNAFDGGARFLEISVRPGATSK